MVIQVRNNRDVICRHLIFAVMTSILVLAGSGYAMASPPAEEWNRTYEVSGITSVESIQQTEDSGYILTGNTRSNAFVLKIGPTGSEQWNWTFVKAHTNDKVILLPQTLDGGYLIAGSSSDGSDNVRLVKFNPEGQEQWNRLLGLEGTGKEKVEFIEQTADGSYVLIGNMDLEGAGYSDIWFMKIDTNGNLQWTNTFGGTGEDRVYSVSQVPDGYIIAGGTKSDNGRYSDYWLLKTDTVGEVQWNKPFRGIISNSMQQTLDGGYIFAGKTQEFGGDHNDLLLVKTDSNGTEQWYRTFGGGNMEFNSVVRQSPDGGYILGGRTFSFDDDYWLIKTDENGNVQWDRTYKGLLDCFMQTHDDGYIIKGDFYDPSKTWLVKKTLIKTDSNGNEQWDIRIEGDELNSVLLTADGGYMLAGIKDSKLLLVKLSSEQAVLTAQFTHNPDNPGANQTITFNASASYNPYGNITYYQWDFEDGSYINTTHRTVTHSYDESGNYSVDLTVRGSIDNASSITKDIIIQRSAPPIKRWDKTFGGRDDDRAYSLNHAFDGGYILTGIKGDDFWFVKTDALGVEQCNWTFGGAEFYNAYSVMQTYDGGYIIAGNNFSLVKTDAEGIEQWNRTFRGGDYDNAYSVLQTLDRGYLLAGRTESYGAGFIDIWLVKTDSEGVELWNRTFGWKGRDCLDFFQQTFDGGYILSGHTRSFGIDSSDFWLVKTDQNGVELWNRTDIEREYSIQQTLDGGFIMAGVIRSQNSLDCLLVKIDYKGVEMWNRTIVRPNENNIPYIILQNPECGFIIAGETWSGVTSDMWLVSTEPDGHVQWELTFGGTGNDVARSVLLAADGGLVVAGDKDLCSDQGTDFWLIKLGGTPVEPEGGDELIDDERLQTPDLPGFCAVMAFTGLLVWVCLARRRL